MKINCTTHDIEVHLNDKVVVVKAEDFQDAKDQVTKLYPNSTIQCVVIK